MRQLLTTVDTLAGTWHRAAIVAREHRHHERDRAADPPHLRRSRAIRGRASARADKDRDSGQPRPWSCRWSSTSFGRHQGHGGEGNAGIRHHNRLRGRPAGWVQCLDFVSPCAGWTHRSCRDRDVSHRVICRKSVVRPWPSDRGPTTRRSVGSTIRKPDGIGRAMLHRKASQVEQFL